MRREPAGGDAAIVVFDGVCVLCSRSVRFLARRDARGALRYAALQGQTGARLLREAGLDPDDPVSFLVVQGGIARTESDALVAVLRLLPMPWPLLARVLGGVPRRLRDAAYLAVARRRYRWFGRRDACEVPDADLRARCLP